MGVGKYIAGNVLVPNRAGKLPLGKPRLRREEDINMALT
jgi:hypothetical protein